MMVGCCLCKILVASCQLKILAQVDMRLSCRLTLQPSLLYSKPVLLTSEIQPCNVGTFNGFKLSIGRCLPPRLDYEKCAVEKPGLPRSWEQPLFF